MWSLAERGSLKLTPDPEDTPALCRYVRWATSAPFSGMSCTVWNHCMRGLKESLFHLFSLSFSHSLSHSLSPEFSLSLSLPPSSLVALHLSLILATLLHVQCYTISGVGRGGGGGALGAQPPPPFVISHSGRGNS